MDTGDNSRYSVCGTELRFLRRVTESPIVTMLLICAVFGHDLFTLFHCIWLLSSIDQCLVNLGIRGAGLMYHCMWSRRPSIIPLHSLYAYETSFCKHVRLVTPCCCLLVHPKTQGTTPASSDRSGWLSAWSPIVYRQYTAGWPLMPRHPEIHSR